MNSCKILLEKFAFTWFTSFTMQKSQNSDLIGYSKCTASAPFPGKTLQQFIPATPFDKLAKLGRLDSSTSCHEEPEGLCTRHFLPSKSKIGVGGITDYSVSSTFLLWWLHSSRKYSHLSVLQGVDQNGRRESSNWYYWDDYPVSAGYIQCVDCGACQGDSARARGQMYLIASVQILICSGCAPSSYKYGYNSSDRRYDPSYPIIRHFIVGAHNSI